MTEPIEIVDAWCTLPIGHDGVCDIITPDEHYARILGWRAPNMDG